MENFGSLKSVIERTFSFLMRRLRSGAIVLLSISSVRNHERSALDTKDGRITDSENLFLTAPRSIRTDSTRD